MTTTEALMKEVVPYFFSATQDGATITLKRIDPRDPDNPLTRDYEADPSIVGTLELNDEDHDGKRLWAVWQDSPNTLAWVRYRFEAGAWDLVAQTQAIENGIEAAKEEIKKKVLKEELYQTPSS